MSSYSIAYDNKAGAHAFAAVHETATLGSHETVVVEIFDQWAVFCKELGCMNRARLRDGTMIKYLEMSL